MLEILQLLNSYIWNFIGVVIGGPIALIIVGSGLVTIISAIATLCVFFKQTFWR